MCIISFHLDKHPRYKLVIAANRDEFYGRPTREAMFWKEEGHPELLAGRDLKAGGTWLGITKDGRIAALTNFRDIANEQADRRSRGDIVTSYLLGEEDPNTFLENLRVERDAYNGFNVLVGSVDTLFYYGNRQTDIVAVPAGTHTVSNALLNTPWPKVDLARTMLGDYLQRVDVVDIDVLFEQLAMSERAEDSLLPNTGVGVELERALSSIFIRTEGYGTRASTVILVTHDNEVTFVERTFVDGAFTAENAFEFVVE